MENVGINLKPGLDQDVHIAKGRYSRIQALSLPSSEKVAPQV
jgi:hypothetical protein